MTILIKNNKLIQFISKKNFYCIVQKKEQLINKINFTTNKKLLCEFEKNINNSIKFNEYKNDKSKIHLGILSPVKISNSYYPFNIYGLVDKNIIIKIIFDYICDNPNHDNKTIENYVDNKVIISIKNNINKISFNEIYEYYDKINVKYLINRIKYLTSNKCVIYNINKNDLICNIYNKTAERYKINSRKITKEDIKNIFKNDCYLSSIHKINFDIDFSTFPIIDYTKYDKYHGKNSFVKTIYEINGYIIVD